MKKLSNSKEFESENKVEAGNSLEARTSVKRTLFVIAMTIIAQVLIVATVMNAGRLVASQRYRAELTKSYEAVQDLIIQRTDKDVREKSIARLKRLTLVSVESKAFLVEVQNSLNEGAVLLGIPVRTETYVALETLMGDVIWSRDGTTEDVRVDTDGDGVLDAEITGTVVMGERPAEMLAEARMNSMPRRKKESLVKGGR